MVPVILLWALTRRVRPFLIAVAALAPFLFWPSMQYLLEPRISELAVRGAMPLLIVAFLAVAVSSRGSLTTRVTGGHRLDVVTGVLCGVAVLVSTEHGLAITLATGIVFLITPARGEETRERLLAVLFFGIASIVAVLAGAVAIAGGGWADALRYAFVTIPADQFWYFGVPPNFPLTAWRGFLGSVAFWLVLSSLIASVALWCLRRLVSESWPVLVLVMYGLFSTATILAILNPANLATLGRTLLIAAAWATVALLPRWEPIRRAPRTWAFAAVAVWLVTVVPASLPHALARYDDLKVRDPVGGSYSGVGLSPDWTQHVAGLRDTLGPKPDVWSLFGGVVEAEGEAMNPTGVDYVFHALGQGRDEYMRDFARRRPAFATTPRLILLRGEGNENYLHMLWNEHWPWFRELLTHYVPERATPFSLIWRRRSFPVGWPAGQELQAPPAGGDGGVVLQPPTPRRSRELLSVRVEYKAKNRLGAVPFFGRLPRYLIYFEGTATPTPASLPPDRSVWEFPLFVSDGAVPRVRPVVKNLLPGAGLEIKRISYSEVDLPETVIRFMLEEGL